MHDDDVISSTPIAATPISSVALGQEDILELTPDLEVGPITDLAA
jgi:hypothetical protein